MSIEQLAIHMDTNTVNIDVWHHPGASTGVYVESYEQAFEEYVTGQGQGVPTLLPAFSTPIEIPAYSTHTFYTSGTQHPLSIFFSYGSSLHSTFASDSNIEVKEGWSVRFPFNTPESPTQFNGKGNLIS